MTVNNEKEVLKKLTTGVVIFIILCICLCITTFALVYAMVTVEDNVFETGFVAINLNDGEAVIDDAELFFEPGMTIKKEFFIENESSRPVYYRLYFNNLQGNLVKVLRVTIVDKTDADNVKVLYGEKIADELRRFNVETVNDPLASGERRELEIIFHLGETENNDYQNSGMSFDLCADAVQADNNPDKEFNETAPVSQESVDSESPEPESDKAETEPPDQPGDLT